METDKEKSQQLNHNVLKTHREKMLWECKDVNGIHEKQATSTEAETKSKEHQERSDKKTV